MNDTSPDRKELRISPNGNSERDFGLDANETSDLEFLRDLYPGLTQDQLLELKERLDGYFDVALEIFLEKHKSHLIDD